MKLDDIFQTAESHEFSARLSLASSRTLFVRMLEGENSYQALLALLKGDIGASQAVLKRLKALSRIETDRRYQNPYDIALAAYTWALYNSGGEYEVYTKFAIDLVSVVPDIWWAAHLAESIHERISRARESGTSTTTATLQYAEPSALIQFGQPDTFSRTNMRFAVRLHEFEPGLPQLLRLKEKGTGQSNVHSSWSQLAVQIRANSGDKNVEMRAS